MKRHSKSRILKLLKSFDKMILKSIILFLAAGSLLFAFDANSVIKGCTACHGTNFSRKALGKSKIVKDMNSTQIYFALNGYKKGTYGSSMKGLMKMQVNKFTDNELKELSKAIAK